MKAGALYIAILAAAMLVIPMLAPGIAGKEEPQQSSAGENSQPTLWESGEVSEPPRIWESDAVITEDKVEEPTGYIRASFEGSASFRVLDESTGEVNEISLRDFVRGAAAAEMPVSFHTEALKAQAVAAHTFALYNRRAQKKNPDPALKGADFSADPSNMRVYITEETAREFYGDTYADIYWDKICEAADSVMYYVLEYEDEPIAAAYHAISAGRTEDAANVWQGGLDYLKPVESAGDYLAPDYEASAKFSAEMVRGAVLADYPGADLSGAPEGWFSDIRRSESGYIPAVKAGGIELRGIDVRNLFGLRSHNMDIVCDGGGFTFITYGYGHGVGLSQYGADFLARQGYAFDEILRYYYTGSVIAEVAADA